MPQIDTRLKVDKIIQNYQQPVYSVIQNPKSSSTGAGTITVIVIIIMTCGDSILKTPAEIIGPIHVLPIDTDSRLFFF